MVVLAIAGAVLGPSAYRRGGLLMAPFPIVYLTVLALTTVAVERNVYPLVPAAAVYMRLGMAGLADFARARAPRRAGTLLAMSIAAALAWPLLRTGLLDLGYLRPTTRDHAQDWLRTHVAPESMVYKERYTPNVNRNLNGVVERRFGPRLDFDELRAGWDYVLLADRSYRRWFEPNVAGVGHHQDFQDWYRRTFAELTLVAEFRPAAARLGPVVRVYRVPPPASFLSARSFGSHELFRPGRKRAKPSSAIAFRNGGG